MSSILDYLSERNAQPFSPKDPLNLLDALALARFSYLPFSKIDITAAETNNSNFKANKSVATSPDLKVTTPETIGSISKKMQKIDPKHFYFKEDRQLIVSLGKNPRFANLRVTNYQTKHDKKTVEQFMALTIHLPGDKLLISYIGTDDTLNGWREDCNMAIMDTVPSQKSAKKYFKNIAKLYPKSKIYLAGHSKGGNLAMYVGLTARRHLARRIAFIYSFDGPGLSKKLAQKSARRYKSIGGRSSLSRTINYIPQESVIGRLFSHAEKFEVVKSNAKGFFQHNIYSWEVNLKKRDFVPAAISKKSDFTDRTLSKWIEQSSKKEKEVFIDLVFKILENSKYPNPPEIAADGLRAIPDLYSSFRKLEKSERKAVVAMFKKLAAFAIDEKLNQK